MGWTIHSRVAGSHLVRLFSFATSPSSFLIAPPPCWSVDGTHPLVSHFHLTTRLTKSIIDDFELEAHSSSTSSWWIPIGKVCSLSLSAYINTSREQLSSLAIPDFPTSSQPALLDFGVDSWSSYTLV